MSRGTYAKKKTFIPQIQKKTDGKENNADKSAEVSIVFLTIMFS